MIDFGGYSYSNLLKEDWKYFELKINFRNTNDKGSFQYFQFLFFRKDIFQRILCC